jgi:transmembrane sensor
MSDQDRSDDISVSTEWVELARYVAGECTPEQSAEMQSRLAADADRAAFVAALGEALPPATEVTAPTTDETNAALASVRQRMQAEEPAPQRVGRPSRMLKLDSYGRMWRSSRMRAAAAVLVVAAGAVLWRSAIGGNASRATTAPERFASAVGSIDSLRLPDGTRVLLGPGSQLDLAAGYGGSARELTLIGEARFDVVHDAARPFVVHTSAASFRDVGTVFSVHSDAGDGARIVVSEGAVEVQVGNTAVTTLSPGDRAAIAPGGALSVERAAATAEDVAWTKGRLTFRDAPVAQVAADLRRWYGLELRVDPALAAGRLTATFEAGPAGDVGSVIAAAFGGSLQTAGDTLYIVPAGRRTPTR